MPPPSAPSSNSPAAAAEHVVLSTRPAPASLIAGPLWYWLLLVATAALGAGTNSYWDRGGVVWPMLCGALLVMGLTRLAWEIAGWSAATYQLTDRRALARWGVLTRAEISIPLDKVQSVTVVRRLRDRLLGIGSVGITSAGVGAGRGIEVWWIMTANPEQAAAAVRERILTPTPTPAPAPAPTPDAPSQAGVAEAPAQPAHDAAPPRDGPVVVGLTGSIGAGKSTAAALLREMGCVVVDSDAEAREALDRPEVRDSIVSWWGPSMLDAHGKIDRKAVGAIVFERPEERARLERLVHPLVRKSRAAFIERAAAQGAPMVVVDVPLLFEAGVDRECDVTVFIDAPLELRRRRIAGRGWSEADLDKREAAQWPVEDKKGRADERLENAGTQADLRTKLEDLRRRILARPRRRG